MIAHRLRGLVNLHVAGTTVLVGMLLLTMGNLVRYQRFLDLSPDINLMPYLLCVAGGMVFSTRYMAGFAARFHRLTWVDSAQLATKQIILVALLIFGFMFAFKDRSMSRLFMGTYLAQCWVLLLFVNIGLPRLLSRLFFERERKLPTLFVGPRRSLDKLKHWLAAKEMLGLMPVGFLSPDESSGSEPSSTGIPFLGSLTELSRRIEETGALQLVVLEIPRSTEDGRYIIDICQSRGCRLLIYSNLAEILRHPFVTVNEEGHLFYTLQEEPLEDPINRVMKRAFDVMLSLPVVLFLLPPLALWVWLMQRLQAPGPVFFVQARTGHSGQMFRMLKFRSMYVADRDEQAEARQAKKGDGRIFPFGSFLRRSSLDEFPQFLNVLLGHMSIVGPRPHLPAHDRQFAQQMKTYRTRFYVKPGITGLAQCRGFRGEITDPEKLQKRVESDIAYVTTWSFWLDVQLTLKTAWQVFFPPKSAY